MTRGRSRRTSRRHPWDSSKEDDCRGFARAGCPSLVPRWIFTGLSEWRFFQDSQAALVGPVLPGEKPIRVPKLPAGAYPEWNTDTATPRANGSCSTAWRSRRGNGRATPSCAGRQPVPTSNLPIPYASARKVAGERLRSLV